MNILYYTILFDAYWVKAIVMEVSMSISGFCIYDSLYIGAVKRYGDINIRDVGCR